MSAVRKKIVNFEKKLKGLVDAIVIFNHGLKFRIIFLVSEHPAHEKLIASKKNVFS